MFRGILILATGAVFTIALLVTDYEEFPFTKSWLILSVSMVIAGILLVIQARREKLAELEEHIDDTVTFINAPGVEKVKITKQNAKIHTGNFRTNNNNTNSDLSGIVVNTYNVESVISANSPQSYIVFRREFGAQAYNYISEQVNMQFEELESLLESADVNLYLDPVNPGKYYYDLSAIIRKEKKSEQ